MSLYNMMFGTNSLVPLLKGMLDLDSESQEWPTGRFQDIYLSGDGNTIILYTRNGGGNREECWCRGDSPWIEAQHFARTPGHEHPVTRSYTVTTKEENVDGLTVITSLRPEEYYDNNKILWMCDAQGSEFCTCPACIINFRMPTHPAYLKDWDDDYDSTYAYIEFRVPESFLELTRALVLAMSLLRFRKSLQKV